MAKIGCLKPFRGTASSLANIVLEDGEIAFETTNKCIYMGNGVDPVSSLTPFLGKSTPKVVSWSSGTDSEIVDLIDAPDRGIIDLYNDAGWRVGDERVVHLSAMSAIGVGESHAAQDVTFVLMHRGLYKDVNDKTVNFVVGMKDCLAEAGYMQYNGGPFSSWKESNRRAWCNNTFHDAIPSSIAPIFKRVKVTTATISGASTNDVTNDYFFLPAEKEIQGSMIYSNAVEANVLRQFEWYSTPSNKSKICNGVQFYYNRSPWTVQSFCCTDADGTADHNNNAGGDGNLSIHGCI